MTTDLSIYQHANRAMWNAWAGLHWDSEFYDVAAFKKGQSSLKYVEIEEMGDVAGKRLLHLQCHFGMDTLSWARQGAVVTGVDFSPDAVALAKKLSEEVGIEAEFVCADVLRLPANLENRFDIVFTSYGTIGWFGDLVRWAEGISRCLAPGGVFHMVEFHPFLNMLDDDSDEIAYPYLGEETPHRFVANGSYAVSDSTIAHENYQWFHSLSAVVNALVGAGLTLDYLHEFDHMVYNCRPLLLEREPGRNVLKHHPVGCPLMYSLRARKPI